MKIQITKSKSNSGTEYIFSVIIILEDIFLLYASKLNQYYWNCMIKSKSMCLELLTIYFCLENFTHLENIIFFVKA